MSIHSSNRSESIQRQDVTTSTNFLQRDFKTPRDLQEEVILLFYNSMLNLVVREWNRVDEEGRITEAPQEEQSDNEKTAKDFKDLSKEDLQTHDVTNVDGSKVSLARRSSRRSSSALSSKSKLAVAKRSRSFSKRLSARKGSKLDEQTSYSLELSDVSTPYDWVLDTYPENVVIVFKNGNIYRGPVERKRFHGYGSFTWNDGTIYEGEFSEGYITGKGTLYYKDCSYYKGEFCKGLLHGEGCMHITPTNILYSGQWKGGKKNGKGWLYYGPGNWYDGEWLDDFRHGKGIRQYDKGSMYEGDWFRGLRQGQGTMVWSNHDYYRGEWKNGTMHGYGEYIWKAFFNKAFAFPVINKFEGNWVEGTRTGEGVLNFGFNGGARMMGYWVKNMKHGSAVVVCGNGKTMAGKPLFMYDKPVDPDIWYGKDQNSDTTVSTRSFTGRAPFEKSMDRIMSSNNSCEIVSLSDFPKATNQPFNPLCIPVHYEPQQVDLNYYLKSFAAKYKLHEGSNINGTNSEDILSNEETKLRNVIISCNLPLKHIYYKYAYIATIDPPQYRASMIRMFLWQLYFDIDISKRGLSLIDTDLCMLENPDCGLETEHDPFERIYFWQFLQSLIAVAWRLYRDAFQMDPFEGTLAKILRKFIYDDLLPNAGKTKGTALCEYKDLLPIQSVYMLYRSIGDPPTARKLYKSCILKGYPLCSEKIMEGDEIKYLKPGSNITVIGATVIYLPDDEEIGSRPQEPTPYPFKHEDTILRNLHIFTRMKRKKLIDCIAEICPPVVENGFIVNMEYPISFLEFYNIILLITCTKIDDILNREKLKEEIKAAQEQQLIVSAPKLSKRSIQKDKKDKKK